MIIETDPVYRHVPFTDQYVHLPHARPLNYNNNAKI